MEYALEAFWRRQWGARDIRRTWVCENSHMVGGLTGDAKDLTKDPVNLAGHAEEEEE